MDTIESQQLAQRLSAMSLKDARKEVFRLDPDAVMKFYRNSIWDEFHTLFLLPNLGLSLRLVEKADIEISDDAVAANPGDRKKLDVAYKYIEARVEPLTRPVSKY
jgi:hypothetical protein